MKRQKEDTTAIVYAYGCSDPETIPDALREERLRMNAFWDELVRIDNRAERAVWEAAREVQEIDGLISQIDHLSAQISDAVKAKRAERARARAKVDTPELDKQIAELAKARRESRSALWPLLQDWRKEHRYLLRDIEQQRKKENKTARQQCGLFWGNYNRVLDSFERGRQLAKKRSGRMRFSDPQRKDGVLTVQIQRTKTGLGASTDELFNGVVTACMIDQIDHTAFEPGRARSDRRKAAKTWVDIRIDAAGNRMKLPATIHRLPPEDARIKSVQLKWWAEGERRRWQLCLTCTTPKTDTEHLARSACGIDLGWRKQPDGGLRIATVVDSDGKTEYLSLPPDWMAGMDQVERLQQHIDDETLTLAATWHLRVQDLPDDLREPLMGWRPKRGAAWVNQQALHDAVRRRIESVAPGQRADVPETIRHWYNRFRHLGIWRDRLRAKLLRRRRELFRLFARKTAQRYSLIGLEKFDLSAVARTRIRAPEAGDNELHAAARALRQRAAASEFRTELEHQAAKAGATVTKVDSNKTTCICHACGHDNKKPKRQRERLIWSCENCGATWDQDMNAAQNVLNLATGSR